METRKVQQVGYSTLTVSLPRDWASEAGLKPGDIVTVHRDLDGSLKIMPGVEREKRPVKCVVYADRCDQPGLLARIITGAYMIGHETIHVIGNHGLKPDHRDEIRESVRRLTGIGIVEETLDHVTLQSFIDPTKFTVDGLIRRLHIIVTTMQETAMQALVEKNQRLAEEVTKMEEEADRIYWLIVRQLLLCSRDRTIMARIGITSPLHLVGNRVVAKDLEEMGDSAEAIARETLVMLKEKLPNARILSDVANFNAKVRAVSEKAVKAFLALDMKMANEAIAQAKETKLLEKQLAESLCERCESIVASGCGVSTNVRLRSIVWNIAQIAGYANMISEITMNRTLEAPSDICNWDIVGDVREGKQKAARKE